MAINLNVDKFGAQFQEFVNLATRNAGDPDTIVCLDDHERGRAPESLLGPVFSAAPCRTSPISSRSSKASSILKE